MVTEVAPRINIPLANWAVEEPPVRGGTVSLVLYHYVVVLSLGSWVAAVTTRVSVHHAASVGAIWECSCENVVVRM